MSEWIKCSERMPEEGNNVLVSAMRGNIITGAVYLAYDWYDRTGERWNEVFSHPVTHWMPLPDPPK